MIREVDEVLKRWGEQVDGYAGGFGGGNLIAMLMACRGELIRGTRGSRVLMDDDLAQVDLVVNGLRYDLFRLVHEHYRSDPLSTVAQKASALGYPRIDAYYRALDTAHRNILAELRKRMAA